MVEIRVTPGSRRPGLRVDGAGRLHVAVTEAPEKGKANAAVVAALAEGFGVPKRAISVVAGSSGRSKRVRVLGLSPDDVDRFLRSLGADPGSDGGFETS